MTRFQFLTLAALLTIATQGAHAATSPAISPTAHDVAKTTIKTPVVVAPSDEEVAASKSDDKAKPAPTPKPKPKPGPRDDGDGD